MELKKIWATGLAGAAIAASLAVPTVARATTVEQTVVEGLSLSTPLSELSQAPNNDELFNEYVRRLFYGDFDISLLGTSGYDQLNDGEREIYDLLEDAIEQIASGTRERTDKIALPEESYDLADLGSFDLTTEEGKDAVSSAVFAKWNETYDYATAYYALLDDHPYEFYWFDKTGRHGTTGAFLLSYSWQTSGGTITISPTISFLVAENYCANTSDPYIVDTTGIQRAQSAAANAQEIIGKHASESDYQKLVSYRDEICNLVSYNDEAAADDNATNMDPWALVYVFDKDASTEVVCEGYSKAFQYLCDLSDFNSSLVRENWRAYAFVALRLLVGRPGAIVRLVKNFTKGNPGVKDDGAYGELLSIGVAKEAQGTGAGKNMLRALETRLRESGVDRLSLTTDYYDNEQAVGFYKSQGYEVMYDFVTYPERRMYRLIKRLK